MERRNRSQCSVLHIYQRSVKGYLLFYSVIDFLVFFTIICVSARRHGVVVIGVCPMFDHIHMLIKGDSRKRVVPFMNACLSLYAREFNGSVRMNGSVFRRSFGCARKTGAKAIRTACSYLYNNPGEKKLCSRAETYRWTFLAYAVTCHPFSAPIKQNKASRAMRKAIKMIDYHRKRGNYLRYEWLEDYLTPLDKNERQQFVDYIISRYNCLDYNELLSFYEGSYEKACLAFASNQGSEYEIKEEYYAESHRAYLEISAAIKHNYNIGIKSVLREPPGKRQAMLLDLLRETSATRRQLVKYLRL